MMEGTKEFNDQHFAEPTIDFNLAVGPAYKKILQEHRERLAEELRKTNDAFVVPGTVSNGWKLSPTS